MLYCRAVAGEKPSSDSVWLWPGKPPAAVDAFRPWLEPFLVEGEAPRGALLVLPGGGYHYRSWKKEGEHIAERLNREGWHAFVLAYRVAPNLYPAALLDARRAMRLIRHRAAEWRVRPDHLGVIGFSAGGHLAGSLTLLGGHVDREPADTISTISSRPDALALAYPVIMAGEHADQESFANLLGEKASPERLAAVSLEQHVSADMPPTFLWHTAVDAIAPVEASLLLALACRAKRVPFELHVYPEGRHGMGLAVPPAREDRHVASWMPLCCEWLRTLGW